MTWHTATHDTRPDSTPDLLVLSWHTIQNILNCYTPYVKKNPKYSEVMYRSFRPWVMCGQNPIAEVRIPWSPGIPLIFDVDIAGIPWIHTAGSSTNNAGPCHQSSRLQEPADQRSVCCFSRNITLWKTHITMEPMVIQWLNNGLTMVSNGILWDLPSGKRLHSNGKSPSLQVNQLSIGHFQ